MKLFFCLILGTLILSGCSKNPSSLACEVWEEKRVETSKVVDYWSELSGARKLSLDENRQAWKDQDDYIAVLREMDSVGCKY